MNHSLWERASKVTLRIKNTKPKAARSCTFKKQQQRYKLPLSPNNKVTSVNPLLYRHCCLPDHSALSGNVIKDIQPKDTTPFRRQREETWIRDLRTAITIWLQVTPVALQQTCCSWCVYGNILPEFYTMGSFWVHRVHMELYTILFSRMYDDVVGRTRSISQ